MTVTANSVITPQTVGNGIATLTSPTAITSRANIAGTTGLVALKPVTTNGAKVYEISWKSKGTSVAGSLCIWRYDGTTSYLRDELPIAGVTPSTTVASESGVRTYNNLALKSTEALYCSVTVAQDLNVFAQASDL